MATRSLVALVVLAAALLVPAPAAAQEARPECRTAQQLLQTLAPRQDGGMGLPSPGSVLPPTPSTYLATSGLPPLAPYPYLLSGWSPVPRPHPVVAAGWMLAPSPFPATPYGWGLLPSSSWSLTAGGVAGPARSRPAGELAPALRQLAEVACGPETDTMLAGQYAELVSLLGYLQGDVADALERPTREILDLTDSPRVRELAAVILAAIATLRHGGPP
jgi:hypothetical protein